MNNKRKLDLTRLPPLRPVIEDAEDMPMHIFVSTLKKFADEYLRAAIELTADGETCSVTRVSLRGMAYLLRLMVEYGNMRGVLKAKITVDERLTLDVEFPEGLPPIEKVSKIAAAGRGAGLHFELRGNRVIFRTALVQTGKFSVYSGTQDRFYEILYSAFFTEDEPIIYTVT